MTTSNFDDVGDFHRKFGLHAVLEDRAEGDPYSNVGPTMAEADEALMAFRTKFLHEELQEFEEAIADQNIVQAADALIDMVYVAMGTAHLLGLPWQELWIDVQEANMRKQRALSDGSDSKRGSSFDVVKPEGWQGPRGAEILRRHGFDS